MKLTDLTKQQLQGLFGEAFAIPNTEDVAVEKFTRAVMVTSKEVGGFSLRNDGRIAFIREAGSGVVSFHYPQFALAIEKLGVEFAKTDVSDKNQLPVKTRGSAGSQLTAKQKREVLSTLKDAYVEQMRPYEVQEYQRENGSEGRRRVWLGDASLFMVASNITGRNLRWYVELPDGRIAHPTEVNPNLSANAVNRAAKEVQEKQEQRDIALTRGIAWLKEHRIVGHFLEMMDGVTKGGATIDARPVEADRLYWARINHYRHWKVFFEEDINNSTRLKGAFNDLYKTEAQHNLRWVDTVSLADLYAEAKKLS